jgi:hypothetical protein
MYILRSLKQKKAALGSHFGENVQPTQEWFNERLKYWKKTSD